MTPIPNYRKIPYFRRFLVPIQRVGYRFPLLLILALPACQSASGSFCTIAPKLYYRQQVYDAMTDREAARTLAYLKTGEKLCGWKP